MQLLPYAILDMDGTLIDSTGMWDHVADRVLGHWGKTFPREDRDDTLTLTVEGTAAYFVRRYDLPATAGEVAQRIRDEAARLYPMEAVPKPGAEAALQAMQAAGVRMCVVSGTEKPLIDAALDHLGLLRYFAFTVACATPQGKAEPEAYLRALHGLGAAVPAEVMVFEDSPTALHTARKAGFYTVAVWDTYTAAEWPDICALADANCPGWPQWLASLPRNTRQDPTIREESAPCKS